MNEPNPNPAPLTPDIAGTPVPEPVTFTAEQKARIDSIVRDAMSRAAKETRADLDKEKQKSARLQQELDTAVAAAQGDKASEVEMLKSSHAKELADVKHQHAVERRDNAILRAAAESGFVNANEALKLVDAPALNENDEFDEAAIRTAVQSYANKSPHLIRGVTRTGSGSTPNGNVPVIPAVSCEKIFGKGSDARLANKIAQSNPGQYRTLKAQAVAKGLI